MQHNSFSLSTPTALKFLLGEWSGWKVEHSFISNLKVFFVTVSFFPVFFNSFCHFIDFLKNVCLNIIIITVVDVILQSTHIHTYNYVKYIIHSCSVTLQSNAPAEQQPHTKLQQATCQVWVVGGSSVVLPWHIGHTNGMCRYWIKITTFKLYYPSTLLTNLYKKTPPSPTGWIFLLWQWQK